MNRMRRSQTFVILVSSILLACSRTPQPGEVSTTSPEVHSSSTVQHQLGRSDADRALALAAKLPSSGRLSPGWNTLIPGEGTSCALDTPYSFFARPGDPDKLVIYFEGGGGCWSAETCASGSDFYDSNVDLRDHPDRRSSGVLDLSNEENPLRDFSFVFIPSCTGDIHTGSNVRQYPKGDGGTLEVKHFGFENAASAVNWIYANYHAPDQILITGCSAGSVGSAFFAPFLMEHYATSGITQLGDSLSFTFHRPLNLQEDYATHDLFPPWIADLNAIEPGNFRMSEFYRIISNTYPGQVFSQFNYDNDQVQERYFVAVGGEPGKFADRQEQALLDIHSDSDNFYSYTVNGRSHCILPRSEFYSLEVKGIRLADWLQDLMDRSVDQSLIWQSSSQ